LSADSSWKALYRIGGAAWLIAGVLLIIGVLGVLSLGGLPTSGQAVLTVLGGQKVLGETTTIVLAIAVLLTVPAILALFVALSGVSKVYAAIASGFVGLFIAMDFGVNTLNLFSLISLVDKYAAATTEAQRAGYVATADLLLSAYSAGVSLAGLVFSVGILFFGLAMLKGVFSKWTAYLGLLAGIVGIISSIPVSALGFVLVVGIILDALFDVAVGYRLYKLV